MLSLNEHDFFSTTVDILTFMSRINLGFFDFSIEHNSILTTCILILVSSFNFMLS